MKSTFIAPWLALACSFVSAAPIPPSKVTVSPLSAKVQANIEVYGDTSNQLSLCRDVTVIFARGTIESGNIGTYAGPAFFTALAEEIGSDKLGVQGVPYAASIIGYLEGGDPAAATMFAQMADQAATQCPDTKLVLSGYSQGAMVVHQSTDQMAASTLARVKAVVLFGDPFDGRPIENIPESIVDTFCFSFDLIYAAPAANFVAGLISV